MVGGAKLAIHDFARLAAPYGNNSSMGRRQRARSQACPPRTTPRTRALVVTGGLSRPWPCAARQSGKRAGATLRFLIFGNTESALQDHGP